jgi:hypothetical protein
MVDMGEAKRVPTSVHWRTPGLQFSEPNSELGELCELENLRGGWGRRGESSVARSQWADHFISVLWKERSETHKYATTSYF